MPLEGRENSMAKLTFQAFLDTYRSKPVVQQVIEVTDVHVRMKNSRGNSFTFPWPEMHWVFDAMHDMQSRVSKVWPSTWIEGTRQATDNHMFRNVDDILFERADRESGGTVLASWGSQKLVYDLIHLITCWLNEQTPVDEIITRQTGTKFADILRAQERWDQSMRFTNATAVTAAPQRDRPRTKVSGDAETLALVRAILAYRNVVLEGVAGTGKSFAIATLKAHFDKVTTVVFHGSSDYEGFVEGLRPVAGAFETYPGVMLEACREAAKNPSNRYLLVLDEINRANAAKVLGDLLLALEPSKRVGAPNADAVLSWEGGDLPPSFIEQEFKVQLQALRTNPATGSQYRGLLVVPDNLYVLATMNTTDRSVGQLDLALRRRFVTRRMEPLPAHELESRMAHSPDLLSSIRVWEALNQAVERLVGPDAMLGHSYFFEFDEARRRAEVEGTEVLGPERLWLDMLLPQLGESLVGFGAVARLEDLRAALASTFGSLNPLRWLVARGAGLDATCAVRVDDQVLTWVSGQTGSPAATS